MVCSYTDELGLSSLTAYVIPGETKFVLPEVKKKLSRYLTFFMILEFFVLVDHIPLTPNGKPDLKSLSHVLKEGDC
ncbi:MAG: hypothetical protein LUC60_05690 [Lachnospiraceae bacterium]|nr:hypothetical protein [Lachnospiraceae bacterium]